MQHFARDEWGQAQRGFVQHQQARARHQRAANGQHLALTARQRGRDLHAPLAQAREDVEHFLHALRLVALATAPARKAAQQQVVLDGHLAKQLALFRHQADALRHHGLHAGTGNVLAFPADAALGGQQPHGGTQQRGFARAVGADDGDDLTFLHIQIHLVHGFHRAVGDADALQLQQRGTWCGCAHLVIPAARSSAPPR